jgi:signal peptidase I
MNDERGTREHRGGTGGTPGAGNRDGGGPARQRPPGGPWAGPNGQGYLRRAPGYWGPGYRREPGYQAEPGGRDGEPPPSPGRRRHPRGKRRKARSWWVELPVLVVFALALALVIKTFVVQAFYIPSSSMENTLLIGDKVLVNKLVYDFRGIHRGDIVVFNGEGSWDPASSSQPPPLQRLWNAITGLFGTAPGVHDYIKRVIGLPGDHVACCDVHGRVTVNGVPLSEKSYLYPGDAPSATPFRVIVPPGDLWVMGDHRSVSYDSRQHQGDPGGGAIPERKVVGRAFIIVWPVSRWRVLPIPATFEQPKLAAGASVSPVAGTPPGTARLAAAPGLPAQPASPLVPLMLGFAVAVPLTALERRARRSLASCVRASCVRAGCRAGRSRRAGRRMPGPRHAPVAGQAPGPQSLPVTGRMPVAGQAPGPQPPSGPQRW